MEGPPCPKNGLSVYLSPSHTPDNWALLYAQQLALAEQLPLHVCFCLMPRFLDATIRQFGFMLEGLREVAKVLPAHSL